jgi:hypothetical protein
MLVESFVHCNLLNVLFVKIGPVHEYRRQPPWNTGLLTSVYTLCTYNKNGLHRNRLAKDGNRLGGGVARAIQIVLLSATVAGPRTVYYSKRVNDRRRTSERDYHANEMGVDSKRVVIVFGHVLPLTAAAVRKSRIHRLHYNIII